jgi:hypothetical protein
MRDRIEPEKLSYRNEHQTCEICRAAGSVEVHHESPSFIEITQYVLESITADQIADCLGDWDWFVKEDFALPEGHDITRAFDAIHSSATLQALCRVCHNGTKKKTSR